MLYYRTSVSCWRTPGSLTSPFRHRIRLIVSYVPVGQYGTLSGARGHQQLFVEVTANCPREEEQRHLGGLEREEHLADDL